jgi:hypothetical protein
MPQGFESLRPFVYDIPTLVVVCTVLLDGHAEERGVQPLRGRSALRSLVSDPSLSDDKSVEIRSESYAPLKKTTKKNKMEFVSLGEREW